LQHGQMGGIGGEVGGGPFRWLVKIGHS
jgi:hypothetical protein